MSLINRGFVTALAVTGTIGLSGVARSQDKAAPQRSSTEIVGAERATAINDFDRRFAKDAFISNLSELTLGKLGTERARNERVKELAGYLIEVYQAANAALRPIVERYEIELPADLVEQPRDMQPDLANARDSQFDRKFVSQVIEDHKMALDRYAVALSGLKNPELRDYADQAFTAMREHLQVAALAARSISPTLDSSSSASQKSDSTSARLWREPPRATALLNTLSADGYLATSDFARRRGGWIITAEKGGEEVTIIYDMDMTNYEVQ